jgi:transaldolase
MTSPIEQLHALGQSIWYDNIERQILENGALEGMIRRGEIRGVTSNPSIFGNAIAKGEDYQGDIDGLAGKGRLPLDVYEHLAIADIQHAADLFRPLYEAEKGGDGYVSLEVNPHLANDTAGTIAEARRLWAAVDRPNLMVKIPGTQAGLPAITETIAAGLNINVTLIFSLQRYREVIEAYLTGLEQRLSAGESIGQVSSVASFFVSRLDSKVDPQLEGLVRMEAPTAPAAKRLMGSAAVANARAAYQIHLEAVNSHRFQNLLKYSARPQRPLWASTSTKNPAYSDVKYVEELIGPNTVNTIPHNTLAAFKDHGTAELTLEPADHNPAARLDEIEALGISLNEVTQQLEAEGVAAFSEAFDMLIQVIEGRMAGGG